MNPQEMYAIRQLYYETHIVPTEEDFLQRINNQPTLYLVLYWLKLEHLYDHFLEEEMDIEAIQLMRETDLRYFNVHRNDLFRQYVRWLQTPIAEIEIENANTIPRYIQTTIS